MQLKSIHLAAGLLALSGSVISCVEINEELGKEYIPLRHQYDVYTETVYLNDITMKRSDKLSGYSSSRITIGAISDEFGLTTRSSAFTLIPTSTGMDFGENPVCTQFHFSAVRDTLSWPDESQENIIQNINVYELTEEIDEDAVYISDGESLEKIKGERVAPVVTYYGQDSLSFDFNRTFGQKMLDVMKDKSSDPAFDSVSNYVKELPGIYMTVDAPVGTGGRINMFDLPIEVSESYYISGNYAELKFRAKYGDRENVDTSFLFFFGAQAMQVYQDTQSSYTTPPQTPQYALNVSTSADIPEDPDKIYIRGGDGMKPVISSREIKESLTAMFESQGVDPDRVIIHKASVILPYKTDNYEKMYLYPDRLSPTCRITSEPSEDDENSQETVTFAGLTDSSVESENQGDINRSTECYAPDISHHVQEILRRADDTNYDDYDIWLLTMANEIVMSSGSDNSSALSDYYRNLAYYDYYNSLYGYGYGGYYGGYGGYYDNYYGMSNYYNYMLASQYASTQSTSQTTISMQLDKDRYYAGVLTGPGTGTDGTDDVERPRLTITYSVSKTGN